jgi:hypothetical protein
MAMEAGRMEAQLGLPARGRHRVLGGSFCQARPGRLDGHGSECVYYQPTYVYLFPCEREPGCPVGGENQEGKSLSTLCNDGSEVCLVHECEVR